MTLRTITGALGLGDSIMAGAGLPTFAYRYLDIAAPKLGITIVNNGYVGDEIFNMVKKYPTQDAPLYSEATCNTAIVDLGINNIIQVSEAEGDLEADYRAMTAMIHATGFQIVATTLMKFGNLGSFLTAADFVTRDTFNKALLANPASFGVDLVIDFAGIPEAQDPTNTAYFQDGIHPTAALDAIMADLVVKTLSPYVKGAATTPAATAPTATAAPVAAPTTVPISPTPRPRGTKLSDVFAKGGHRLVFSEEFTAPIKTTPLGDAGSWGTIRPDWIIKDGKGTPIGDVGFGNSHFCDPASGYNPFAQVFGGLQIKGIYPSPDTTGYTNWASGLIHSHGLFSMKRGFFVARVYLGTDGGTWPAFWLWPTTPSTAQGGDRSQWQEIDFEYYGSNPGGQYWNVHSYFPAADGGMWNYFESRPEMTTGWHEVGLSIEDDFIGYWFDGQLLSSRPTPADYTSPMYVILNLARDQDPKWMTTPAPAGTASYMTMMVDYVRAYTNDPTVPTVDLGLVQAPDTAPQPGIYGAATKSSLATAPTPTPAAPAVTSNVSLVMWGDQYGSDACQCTIAIDGVQVGGTYTVSGTLKAMQTIVLPLNLAKGQHTVTVNFLNDFRDSHGDRNLYLEDVMVAGKSAYHWLPLMSSGPQTANFTVA